jgi:protoporphyrinogen oxidase
MTSTKYIILGAGPSGLAFAHTLLSRGEKSFILLEKESEPGGLCRSLEVDGAPLDIGGGHFLDVRNKAACNFLFRFMPQNEWNLHSRVATIRLRGYQVDHPLEANLWQLPLVAQVDYLESIARAGCVRNEPVPEFFEDWCHWKFGERIAQEYMLPYNRKLLRIPINDIGTYWLYKLPNVSFRETLLSCLQQKMHGNLPVSAQQNPSIQGERRCHRFANYGIHTRDLYKHHQE